MLEVTGHFFIQTEGPFVYSENDLLCARMTANETLYCYFIDILLGHVYQFVLSHTWKLLSKINVFQKFYDFLSSPFVVLFAQLSSQVFTLGNT